MISDARGGHVSPGIYTEEQEVSYSVQSLGITKLGMVCETLKGPAFQVIGVKDWSEFVDYFGGTSVEKFKGNGRPKFEGPYIAQEYLKESKKLNVVRVLGLSGYKTSPAYVVTAKFGEKEYPLAVFRSQVSYDFETADGCNVTEYEVAHEWIKSFAIKPYSVTSFTTECITLTGENSIMPLVGTVMEVTNDETNEVIKMVGVTEEIDGETVYKAIGKFAIELEYYPEGKTANGVKKMYINVSLDSDDTDYIYKVINTNPLTDPSSPIFIEAVYDYSFTSMIAEAESGTTVTIGNRTANKAFGSYSGSDVTNFVEEYRPAMTPWIVSEVKSVSDKETALKKLFRFYTISDGNAANYQVKISIQNISPNDGTFDVLVRDFYDTDASPLILEKYSKCTLHEGDVNFIGLKIGTVDGSYVTRSKYVTVEMAEGEGIESCVPAGFLGYPMPDYECANKVNVGYNHTYNTDIKPKRQYFGLNADVLDSDILDYKGFWAYSDEPYAISNGFHLDAILNDEVRKTTAISDSVIKVDGKSGYTFTTVDAVNAEAEGKKIPRIVTESYMKETIYADKNLRKFTVYPFGGFDGWDIYRQERTISDDYKATKYKLNTDKTKALFRNIGSGENALDPTVNLNLPSKAISTDYYAYLGGFNQFANPQDIDINLFVTPGVDWLNNTLLFEDALDVIEDTEYGRGGDALYIPTTPFYTVDGEEYTEEELVNSLEDLDIDTSYACTYYPWVKYFDSKAKMYINLPVTKDVVRDMAYADNKLHPWYAAAGTTTRGAVNCVKACKKTTLSGEDTLYENNINPVKTFAEDGVFIWGNKTLHKSDSQLSRINVRRLMIRIKKLVTRAAKDLIFEQYDATLEKQFRSLVEPILKAVQENRGISDYRIVTECTAETRDQHILPAKILVKPINALEYISITFTIYPESVSFEE